MFGLKKLDRYATGNQKRRAYELTTDAALVGTLYLTDEELAELEKQMGLHAV